MSNLMVNMVYLHQFKEKEKGLGTWNIFKLYWDFMKLFQQIYLIDCYNSYLKL